MANIKSQMKRNRQNEKRRIRNKSVESEIKTRSKHALAAAEAGDAETAERMLQAAQRRLDMAAGKGVIHRNTAARHKSRLSRSVRELLG